MRTSTTRDLRTRFPAVRRLPAEQGEVVINMQGKPIAVFRPFEAAAKPKQRPADYDARLRRRMPKPLTAAQILELHEANRGEG